MAKIVVTFNGILQQEIPLGKPRISVGRRPSNDVVIDHLTVSGQHAAIDTTLNGVFVIDLGSTNGTIVNGQPVKKHLLQDGDVIEIGKFKLSYDANFTEPQPLKVGALSKEPSNIPTAKISAAATLAKIVVLSGKNAGKELILSKPVTTLGSPSVQVIAITRQQNDFYLSPVEGNQLPKLNNQVIGQGRTLLKGNDVIELAGVQMRFLIET